MFGFMKKMIFTAMTFFSYNVLKMNSLECASMNNQKLIKQDIQNGINL